MRLACYSTHYTALFSGSPQYSARKPRCEEKSRPGNAVIQNNNILTKLCTPAN